MTAFLPDVAFDPGDDGPHPQLIERSLIREDRLARWEVRAAQWRAHELATRAFGPEVRMGLTGLRRRGALRGMLRLEVPFRDLASHRRRESIFMAAVRSDPLLTRVPLVYVVGPAGS